MPKAPQEIVDRINNNEDQGFEDVLLPEDMYLAEVIKNKEYEPSGGKEFGGIYIIWKIVQPREHAGVEKLLTLSWSPKAAWKIREFWDALGYDYDSDFDEPVEENERAILEIDQSIIPYGKRKGQISNNIVTVMEATTEAIAALSA